MRRREARFECTPVPAARRSPRGPAQNEALALRGFGRRRLHGRARQRERPRLRRAPLLLLGGALVARRRRRLVAEDDLLRLALEQPDELVLVDRLALDQDARDPVEVLQVLLERAAGERMRLLDHAPDLVVDLARDLLGVVGLRGHLAAQEGHVLVAAEDARPELFAHAVAHDHLLRRVRDLLEVVRGAGRHLVEDELLGGPTAERHRELLHQRPLRRQVAVLARERDRVAQRLAAADDRDLVHFVGVLEVVAHERVAHLVVGRDLALLLGEQPRLLLGPGDDAHDALLELLLPDRLPAAPRGQQCRLVDEIRQVGAREAGRPRGERVEVDRRVERLALGVHLENLATTVAVGPVDDDLPVEAARAEQGGIEDVGPVRGRDQDDVVLQLEPVHLDEELVQRLLALVVAAAEAGAAMAADRVDLVHEDDARRRLLRLLEQVADTRGADADEHLDEVRAGDREERHARFARDRAREQRLTGAGRPVEQHALGNARAERLELLGILEELLDLLELLDRLVHAGHVLEADLGRVGRHPLRTRLAEAHHLRAAALHLVHQEDPEAEQEHERQQRREDRPPRRGAATLRVVGDVVLLELRLERQQRLVARVVHVELLAAPELGRGPLLVRVDDELLDRARVLLDPVDQLRVRDLALALRAAHERLARQIDEQHDDDQREEGATKETVQVGPPSQGSNMGLYSYSPRRGVPYPPSVIKSAFRTPT